MRKILFPLPTRYLNFVLVVYYKVAYMTKMRQNQPRNQPCVASFYSRSQNGYVFHLSSLHNSNFRLYLRRLLYFSTGGFFSSLFSSLFGQKELRILILGLDGAGKTTILYRWVYFMWLPRASFLGFCFNFNISFRGFLDFKLEKL